MRSHDRNLKALGINSTWPGPRRNGNCNPTTPLCDGDYEKMDGTGQESQPQLSTRLKQTVQRSYNQIQLKVKASWHRTKCDYCTSPTMAYAHAHQKGKGRARVDSGLDLSNADGPSRASPEQSSTEANTTGDDIDDSQLTSETTRKRRNGHSWRRWAGADGASIGASFWTIRSVRRSRSHHSSSTRENGVTTTESVKTRGKGNAPIADPSSSRQANGQKNEQPESNLLIPTPSPIPPLPVQLIAAEGRKTNWRQQLDNRASLDRRVKAGDETKVQNESDFELPRLSFQSKYSVVPPPPPPPTTKPQVIKNRPKRPIYNEYYRSPASNAYAGPSRPSNKSNSQVSPQKNPPKNPQVIPQISERKDPVLAADLWGSFFAPPDDDVSGGPSVAAPATATTTTKFPTAPTSSTTAFALAATALGRNGSEWIGGKKAIHCGPSEEITSQDTTTPNADAITSSSSAATAPTVFTTCRDTPTDNTVLASAGITDEKRENGNSSATTSTPTTATTNTTAASVDDDDDDVVVDYKDKQVANGEKGAGVTTHSGEQLGVAANDASPANITTISTSTSTTTAAATASTVTVDDGATDVSSDASTVIASTPLAKQ